MSRKRKIVAAAIATTVLGIAAASCGSTETPEESDEPVAVATEESTEESAAPEETPAPKKVAEELREEQLANPEPKETPAQENARKSAESYLEFSAFSREGLIQQLEFEGYSTKDAVYAVRVLHPDWMEQAAKSAQQYLDTSSFSRSGLTEQLQFEGFTEQQAVYGVNQTGL